MKTQGSNRIRTQGWDDEPTAETPPRRVQQAAPAPRGRMPEGMPLERGSDESGRDGPMRDDTGRGDFGRNDFRRGDFGRDGFRSFEEHRTPWWRPSSTWGRAFLSIAALILLGGLATAGYLLKTYLNHDNRFRIAGAVNIQATGLAEVSRAEMLPIFGEDIGRNIFFVPLKERRRELERIPWIESATVMRLLPDQIRVSVVERQPVAFVRQGSQVGLVDANGVLLTMPAALMAKHHYSFPVVSGIDPKEPAEASKLKMALYQRLLSDLDATGQHFSEQISEIDLADPEDARVLMPEQGVDVLAHFGEEHFLERYERYKAHIAQWRQQYPKLASVDLRYEQQAVLQMEQGADGGEIAAGAAAAVSPEGAKTEAAKTEAGETAPKAATVKAASSKAGPAKTVSARTASAKTASSRATSAKPGSGKQGATKPSSKGKTVKAGSKPTKTTARPAKNSAKAKAATARDRKKMAAQRAALDGSKQKKLHAISAARLGQ